MLGKILKRDIRVALLEPLGRLASPERRGAAFPEGGHRFGDVTRGQFDQRADSIRPVLYILRTAFTCDHRPHVLVLVARSVRVADIQVGLDEL